MGWELRGGTRVYYRKQRDPQTGRVRSIYCGGGERGEAAAREDEERRQREQHDKMLRARLEDRGSVVRSPADVAQAAVVEIHNEKKEAGPVATSRAEKKDANPGQPLDAVEVPANPPGSGAADANLGVLKKKEAEPPITFEEVKARAAALVAHRPSYVRSPYLIEVSLNLASRQYVAALDAAGIGTDELRRRGLTTGLRFIFPPCATETP